MMEIDRLHKQSNNCTAFSILVPARIHIWFTFHTLVDLLDVGPAAAAAATTFWHAAGHAAAALTIHCRHDRRADALNLLALVIELLLLGELIALKPLQGLIDGGLALTLVFLGDLVLQLL